MRADQLGAAAALALREAGPGAPGVALTWPVGGTEAMPAGGLAARFSWDWARAVADRFGAASGGTPNLDMLVLAGDGRVLLGPPDLEGTIVADPAGPGPWPDGRRYLVGIADTAGWARLPAPGWRVIARQPADIALAPVRELKRRVAADATVAALLAAALGWLLARAIARPARPWPRRPGGPAAAPPCSAPISAAPGTGRPGT